MTRIIAADDDGIIGSGRFSNAKSLTEEDAIKFLRKFETGRIYGSVERAPRGGRRVEVYLSNNSSGVGRIGRNWVDLIVEDEASDD